MRRALFVSILLSTLPAHAAEVDAPRPLSLDDAVELALKVDPLMEEAKVDRDRSKLGVLRAQLDRISLKVDGQLQELWNRFNIGGPVIGICTIASVSFSSDEANCTAMGGTWVSSNAQGLSNLTANLHVPVFAGFRIDATVKRAQRNEEAAIVQIRRQRRDTALSAARAFWSVRRLELLRDVQRASLERTADAEVVAGGRLKAGLAPPIDKNRATARRLQQLSTLSEYEGQIAEASAQLAVLLGLRGEIRLQGGFTFPEAPPPPVGELVDTAHKGRAEIDNARLQLEVQRQNIRIAQSNYYPQLTLFGLFQYGNNQLSVGSSVRGISQAANPFANLSGALTLGASLNMNFFDTLHTWTTTRDAKYEAARLFAEQRRVERAIDTDVLTAHAKVGRLFNRRTPLRAAVEVARDNARILEARYKSGDALVIELLDAQLELAQAEGSLVDVEAQLELAWIELNAALGRAPGRVE